MSNRISVMPCRSLRICREISGHMGLEMLCWTMELLSTISTTALFAETKISASVSLLCGYTISSDPVGASFESPCFGWQALTVLSTKEASKTRFRGIIFYRRVTAGWVFDEERTFTTCGGEGNASPHVSH